MCHLCVSLLAVVITVVAPTMGISADRVLANGEMVRDAQAEVTKTET